MISMDKVYSIMHYLNDSHVDRVYPIDDTESKSFQGAEGVFKLNNHTFIGINEVQLFLRILSDKENEEPPQDLTISCEFCADNEGKIPIFQFEYQPLKITYNEKTLISFKIDWNAKMKKESHLLTGVKTLKIKLNQPIHRFYLHKTIFRSTDFRYTLENIEQSYYDGLDHVKNKLNNTKITKGIEKIPKELERYVYMAGGAYAWLIVWEKEAKPMKEPKSESNNYADRLFGQVDKAINSYLNTIQNDPNSEYIKPFLTTTTKVDWGIRY